MSWKKFLEEVAAGKKFHLGEDQEWPIRKLTPSETKVLIEILPTPDGGALPQQDVATKLVIEVKTVKSHVDSIYDKFRVDKGGSRITKLRQKLRAEFKQSLAEPQPRKLFGNANYPIPNWVGRDELLTELHTELENNCRVLVLCGQGGIGKTSLAVKLMAACGVDTSKSLLPETCSYDNVLFYKVGESDSFEDLVAKFFDAFGLAPHNDGTVAQKIDSIVQRLHKQRWLVVLDNLESLMEFDSAKSKSAEVGDLLNAMAYDGHNSQIVITSRKRPEDLYDRGKEFGPGVVYERKIPVISKAASIELLKKLGMRDSPADLEWIAERVDGNVLILGLLASYAKNKPGLLRNKPHLVSNQAEPIVREQWEFQGVPAQDLLRRMCVLRMGMNAKELTILRLLQPDGEAMEFTPESEAATEDLLTGLVNADLLQDRYDESDCESRYVLHPLMAETLKAIFAEDLKLLRQYAARFYGSFDRPEELHSPDDLKFVLEELHFYWLLRTEDQYVIQGAMDILPKLRQWCYGELGEEWLQRILTVQTELGRAETASFWGVLGDIARKQGNYDRAEALYHQFLDVSIELGDRAGMASAWGSLEDIARKQGDYEKAEALHQSQEVFYTELGDQAVMASLWGILRDIPRNWENYEKAEALCHQSLKIYTELGNRAGMATSLSILGFITNRRGNYDQAEELYQTCLDIYTELGNRAGMATSLGMLGFIANRQGNYDQAEELYQTCLDIQTELDNQAGMATSWGGQGNIASKRGNYDEAEKLYNQSLKLRTKLGDRVGMATSLRCLGENELRRRNLEAAETWLKKALVAMEDLLQITWQIAETNWGLAQLYRIKGDEQTAQAHYLISHKLYTKLGSKGVLERIEKEWL
jgi:tetratricopeptide (TPR) repeat protein